MDDLAVFVDMIIKKTFAAEIQQLADKKVEVGEAFTPLLVTATNPKFGHYQINNIMGISKLLKANLPEIEASPKALGERLVAAINEEKSEMIGKVAQAAVFVNITLSDNFLVAKAVDKFMVAPDSYPKHINFPKQKILVDFSSPNVAKSMHVGHLRSTIIGDTVCRLFEYLDCEVLRVNHVGDWGTQFGMLIAYLMEKGMVDTAQELPISDLVVFYKAAKVRFDEDKDFCEKAHQEVVKLQSGSELEIKLWKRLCEVSRKEFQRIYNQLDIKLEEVGESFYNPMLQPVVDFLSSLGMVEDSQGAKIIDVGKAFPLMVKKSDGGFSYDTTDLAAMQYRTQELKCDRIIYVTDLGQLPHFELIFEAGKRAGWLDHCKAQHCGFGVVVGEDGKKLKTRSGETVKLQELIDEAVKQAGIQIKTQKGAEYSPEEVEEISKAVGISAIKYADLSSQRTKDYRFSYDKMLSFKGNTASYMLYSYARICAIARKAGIERVEMYTKEHLGQVAITTEQERNLIFTLLRVDAIVKNMSEDLMPHSLCDWMYQVSGAYTDFYEKCRVIDQDGNVNWSRIVLCEMTRQALRFAFFILGLKEVEKM